MSIRKQPKALKSHFVWLSLFDMEKKCRQQALHLLNRGQATCSAHALHANRGRGLTDDTRLGLLNCLHVASRHLKWPAVQGAHLALAAGLRLAGVLAFALHSTQAITLHVSLVQMQKGTTSGYDRLSLSGYPDLLSCADAMPNHAWSRFIEV
jgi:hypothetical protein